MDRGTADAAPLVARCACAPSLSRWINHCAGPVLLKLKICCVLHRLLSPRSALLPWLAAATTHFRFLELERASGLSSERLLHGSTTFPTSKQTESTQAYKMTCVSCGKKRKLKRAQWEGGRHSEPCKESERKVRRARRVMSPSTNLPDLALYGLSSPFARPVGSLTTASPLAGRPWQPKRERADGEACLLTMLRLRKQG